MRPALRYFNRRNALRPTKTNAKQPSGTPVSGGSCAPPFPIFLGTSSEPILSVSCYPVPGTVAGTCELDIYILYCIEKKIYQKKIAHKVHKAMHKAKTRKTKVHKAKEIGACTRCTRQHSNTFALCRGLCAPCAAIRS